MPSLKKYLFTILIIFFVCLLSYFNTLKVPFQFDGVSFIQKNKHFSGLLEKGESEAFWKEYSPTNINNRPFLNYSFTVNYFLGKDETFGYHLVNLGIHILVSIFIFLIVRKVLLFNKSGENSGIPYLTRMPLLASLVFASHPIQTQAITYIMSRSASLCTLTYLASFYCFVLGLETFKKKGSHITFKNWTALIGWGMLSLILIRLGLGIKLIIASIPMVMFSFLILQYNPQKDFKDIFNENKPLFSIVLTFFFGWVLFQFIFVPGGPFGVFAINDFGLEIYGRGGYFLSQIKWLSFYYLNKWFFPINLNLDPDVSPVFSVWNLDLFASLLIIFLIFWFVLKQNRLLIFSFCWFLFCLAPESSFIPLLDLVSEHRLYLPGIGLTMLVAMLIAKRSLFAVQILLILLLAVNTSLRNTDWFSETTLWRDAVNKSPNKSRPFSNLARALILENNLQGGLKNYQKAILLDSTYYEPHHNLGNLYISMGNCKKGIESHLTALLYKPELAESLLSIGTCYRKQGKYKEATNILKKAIEADPNLADTYKELGTVYYFHLKDPQSAKFFFQQAIRIDPANPDNAMINNILSSYQN